jgi:hypothetical protein
VRFASCGRRRYHRLLDRSLRFVLVTLGSVCATFAAGAGAAGSPDPPAPPDPSASSQRRGGGGTRDDTRSLQRQLDKGGTITLNALAGGVCYQTRGLWVSKDGTTITSPDGACIQYLGRSSDARLQSGDGDLIYANAVFFVNRSSMTAATPQHIRISNLRLVVPNGTADEQNVNYGVLVAGNDVTVDNIRVEGAPLDAVQVTGRANGSSCNCASQVVISNTKISAGRRNGISIVSGIGVTLDSNVIQGAGNQSLLAGAAVADTGPWAGIDVEPDLTFYPIKQLTITRNTISNNGGAGVLLALDLNGTLPDVADQLVLDANTITGNGVGNGSFLHGGICLQGGQAGGNGHLSVTNDQITNNTGYGLCTTGYNMQLTLSGNTISGNSSGDFQTFKQV